MSLCQSLGNHRLRQLEKDIGSLLLKLGAIDALSAKNED